MSSAISSEQWKTIELPVNKTVQATILEIISPNLFYAVPSEMSGKEPHIVRDGDAPVLNCAVVNSVVSEGGGGEEEEDF
jgi:hypothetical protein